MAETAFAKLQTSREAQEDPKKDQAEINQSCNAEQKEKEI